MYIPVDSLEAERRLATEDDVTLLNCRDNKTQDRIPKDSPWCKRAVRKVLRSTKTSSASIKGHSNVQDIRSPPWGLNEKVLEKWRAKKKLHDSYLDPKALFEFDTIFTYLFGWRIMMIQCLSRTQQCPVSKVLHLYRIKIC